MGNEASIVYDLPRQLSLEEQEWVSKLLSVDFYGKVVLTDQLNHASVIGYCSCGKCRSIILTCDKSLPKFPSKQRVPVEMTLSANDGVPILFLLHVIDGYVSELEVLRADSERLIHVPDCNDAIVTVNEED